MSELKPCPFCGSQATLYPAKRVKGFYIRCDNLDCQTIKSGNTQTAAIKNWNRRASEPAQSDASPVSEPCQTCGGVGKLWNGDALCSTFSCDDCNGTGKKGGAA